MPRVEARRGASVFKGGVTSVTTYFHISKSVTTVTSYFQLLSTGERK